MLLAGGRLNAGDFVVAEWKDRGETSRERPIAPLHVHHADDEAWYVLEGRLGFLLGADAREAGPGEGVVAPRGIAHTFWNAEPGLTRYLVVMTPRLAALIDALHSGRGDHAAIFREYESELL